MNVISIFIGGGLGAMLRYFISIILVDVWGTLAANVLASFILGFLFSYCETKTSIPVQYKLLLMTGFCGGLSTFSTFALESFRLCNTNGLKFAFLYSVVSVFCCIFAVLVGIKCYNS